MSSLGVIRICCEWSGLINYLWVPSVEPHRHLYTYYYTHTQKTGFNYYQEKYRNMDPLVLGHGKFKTERVLPWSWATAGGKSIAMYIGFIDCL